MNNMGKSKAHKNRKTREELLGIEPKPVKKVDKYAQVTMQLLEDNNVVAEHIEMFNKVCDKYPDSEIESPIFIRENLDLIEVRIEYFKVSLQDKMQEEADSVSDDMREILSNNDYIQYLETVFNHYKTLNN